MEYNPQALDRKWQQYWKTHQTYRVPEISAKPKYFILDMFPYPSGAGLHVGHPLGYVASDIVARYKRFKGFNVLHPMGYDSFGLPAEQYAIQTGVHPAVSTEKNIAHYRAQLDNLALSFDWSREIATSDPNYYRWTQWIFCQIFDHYYDLTEDKATKISALVKTFAVQGNVGVKAVCDEDTPIFTAAEWNAMTEREQQLMLLKYRLTFPEKSYVNWCPALRAVLANDEIVGGVSERGGYPVEKRMMQQWSMRITAYADKLIAGLDKIDWPESLKEQQRNWIGRSQGASMRFAVEGHDAVDIEVFTTRIDTVYGVSFLVLAPEHELVAQLTTDAQRDEVTAYQAWTASRSDVDRQSEVKRVTGAFTGSYIVNPFNDARVPIYIADYVLAGYGTGAVMGVPSGDERDWRFATHFELPIIPILDAQKDIDQQADNTKDGHYINSGIINGKTYAEATPILIDFLEQKQIGRGKVQYRLRNAIFSRQRYWGEPVPVYWNEGVPYRLPDAALPLVLPAVDKYLPTDEGEPPLGRAADWRYRPPFEGIEGGYEYELSTMPGWAGSSWYWYRYMDAHNDTAFADKKAMAYWQNVDFYIGGSEHAVGHLLYSRFWNHFLFDIGEVPTDEPFQKLVNQGMIQGQTLFLTLKNERRLRVNVNLADEKDRLFRAVYEQMVVDDNRFEGIEPDLDIDWQQDEAGKQFVTLAMEVEKMSKSKLNVVNPDDVMAQYGADCFRMYEMFLGPIEQAKPWDTRSMSGVASFLRRLWALFYDDKGRFLPQKTEPTRAELKILHTAIKKVEDDIERFSLNTAVSAFMICVNGLREVKCHNAAILQDLLILIAPFAPHIAEELWAALGNDSTIVYATFPTLNESYLVEDNIVYPLSINGKRRGEMSFPTDADVKDIERQALENEIVKKWIEGQMIKKIIVVKGKMINVVI